MVVGTEVKIQFRFDLKHTNVNITLVCDVYICVFPFIYWKYAAILTRSLWKRGILGLTKTKIRISKGHNKKKQN